MGTRIARLANGDRYVVQQLSSDRAHCWGDLQSYRYDKRTGRVLKHRYVSGQSYSLADVTIETVELSSALLDELWEQALRHLREQGKVLAGRKRVRVYDSPDAKLHADINRARIRRARQGSRMAFEELFAELTRRVP